MQNADLHIYLAGLPKIGPGPTWQKRIRYWYRAQLLKRRKRALTNMLRDYPEYLLRDIGVLDGPPTRPRLRSFDQETPRATRPDARP